MVGRILGGRGASCFRRVAERLKREQLAVDASNARRGAWTDSPRRGGCGRGAGAVAQLPRSSARPNERPAYIIAGAPAEVLRLAIAPRPKMEDFSPAAPDGEAKIAQAEAKAIAMVRARAEARPRGGLICKNPQGTVHARSQDEPLPRASRT